MHIILDVYSVIPVQTIGHQGLNEKANSNTPTSDEDCIARDFIAMLKTIASRLVACHPPSLGQDPVFR